MEIAKGSIAIMGSGETSPALVSVHRNFIKKLNFRIIALKYVEYISQKSKRKSF